MCEFYLVGASKVLMHIHGEMLELGKGDRATNNHMVLLYKNNCDTMEDSLDTTYRFLLLSSLAPRGELNEIKWRTMGSTTSAG